MPAIGCRIINIDHDLHTKSRHDVYLRQGLRTLPWAKFFRTSTLMCCQTEVAEHCSRWKVCLDSHRDAQKVA
jgi:hypothetical protein